ncbi:coagulation factor 5/8 type domain-containing protein [Actinoplanes sp. SE50]|uniref:hypothetical protein n=1 Tax=unclassified Actinoplanes TaxID=2626549 RepID=UPI00023EC139|nr:MULTISPECIES: hypothetical protein [unclassified Actinoplanes]AEV86324.1 coagulation factor 5/8 type domain-containing protein [Actinoplanes sp. SE50/110]ATO84721.1 coagulation factor 5/8 type domain-containing protein [Actinoplanes sp. SE50]SLM02131.1 coagulation factor 5/8 type domain-containing protein [Actinoplanes sp. SE50/110]
MRNRLLPLALTALTLVAAGPPAPAGAARSPAEPVAGTWIGFGYNQDPQYAGGTGTPTPWDPRAFQRMTERTTFIRPPIVRVMLNRDWFNPTGVAGRYEWASVQMTNLYQVLTHYRSLGTRVQLGLWGVQPSSAVNPYTATETATVQADLMRRLYVTDAYTNIVRYTGVNEPNVKNEAKNYSYADWVTATTNLRAAFAAENLPVTLLGGPDTAEATISGQDGDLGLESVTGGAAATGQNAVWRADGLAGFDATFYVSPDTGAADWKFYTSRDGSSWAQLDPASLVQSAPVKTVATNPWYRYEVRNGAPLAAGTDYLRITLPAHAGTERALASLTMTTGAGGTVADPMNDWSHATSHSSGWTHLQGAPTDDWWLEAAGSSLVSGLQTHFYAHELDLADAGYPVQQLQEYPEATLREAVRQVRAAAPGVPVILGETGMKAPKSTDGKDYAFTDEPEHGVRMADLAVQEVRAGVDGAMAWCLDGYAAAVQCGMWDHEGTTEATTALRPWFYTWSLLCRYLPAGSTLYAPAQQPGLRLLQAQAPGSGGWTFVLVNRGTTAVTVPMTAPTGKVTFHRYLYQAAANPPGPVDADGFPVPAGTFLGSFDGGRPVTVPADAVVLITSMS